jgi:hypothetical protein
MSDFNEDDPILRKVQKLVDKAWSSQFPHERDALLAKADALMLRYSIDQFMLLDPSRPQTAKPIAGQSPELREMWYFGQGNDPYKAGLNDREVIGAIHQMFYKLARHFGCRVGHFGWSYSKVVGYPADLDFLEMMFLSLKLHLLSRVDPKVSHDLSWKVNLVALKQAGFKWEEIHRKLDGLPDYPFNGKPWVAGGKGFSAFPNTYNKWLKDHPDEPANLGSPAQWRRSFVVAYEYEIGLRLAEMAAQSAKTIDNLPALLESKGNLLDKFFDEMFPPPPEVEYKASTGKLRRYAAPKSPAMSHQAMAAGRAAARTADLSHRGSRVGGADRKEIG